MSAQRALGGHDAQLDLIANRAAGQHGGARGQPAAGERVLLQRAAHGGGDQPGHGRGAGPAGTAVGQPVPDGRAVRRGERTPVRAAAPEQPDGRGGPDHRGADCTDRAACGGEHPELGGHGHRPGDGQPVGGWSQRRCGGARDPARRRAGARGEPERPGHQRERDLGSSTLRASCWCPARRAWSTRWT